MIFAHLLIPSSDKDPGSDCSDHNVRNLNGVRMLTGVSLAKAKNQKVEPEQKFETQGIYIVNR